MRKETRTIVYDETLKIEAYCFQGIVQPFPNHFHEYYVIGLVENGERRLLCRNKEYLIRPGDIIVFSPGDSHSCVQSDGGALGYRGLNITHEVMSELSYEITSQHDVPKFSHNVINDNELAVCLRNLHERIIRGSEDFGKEEELLLLISMLLQNYGQSFENNIPEREDEVARACEFMELHYADHIKLDQICHHVGLSRSTLLRVFTKSKGVTPYCYLENIRIGKAKILLEQGMAPLEAAMRTGFSDQSHFTNYFNRFFGLTPGMYRKIFLDKKDSLVNRHDK